MHGDNRAVILLNLFFLEGQGGHERDIKPPFDAHFSPPLGKTLSLIFFFPIARAFQTVPD
jgi:hypothetical protein